MPITCWFGYNASNEKKVYGSGASGNKITKVILCMVGELTRFQIDIYDVHATNHRKFGYIKQAFLKF